MNTLTSCQRISISKNILPTIRERFWGWFEAQHGEVKLHRYFHHLNSSQALCFNLFFPFLKEDGKAVDSRLLQALHIDEQGRYTGHFEIVFDKDENTNFDFYLEGDSGQKVFFELKYSEQEFGSCKNDQKHCDKLERHYRRHLQEHIGSEWLEQKMFFKNYQILRNMSYLGRHLGSRLIFIFPKANESLGRGAGIIGKIKERSLGQRVAILYLEDLLERILTVTREDPALQEHFQDFKTKYVLTESA